MAKGPRLQTVLTELVDGLVSDERSRADVIADMGDAAGIDSPTVNDILVGRIACPPIERLRGFARVLDVSLDHLLSVARRGGCSYETANRICVFEAPLVELAAHRSDGFPVQGEWIVVPDGPFTSDHGALTLDEQGANGIVAGFNARGNQMLVDFEHQSMGGKYNQRPDKLSPAAGWIKALRYVASKGLLATIRWEGDAPDMIRTGAYRYLSPVTISEKDTGRVVGLRNVALVNEPAIHGFPPLTPNSRRIAIMADTPTEETTRSVDTLLADLRARLSLPEDATPEDVLMAALQALEASDASDAGGDTETTASKAVLKAAINKMGLARDATLNDVVEAINSSQTVPQLSFQKKDAALQAEVAKREELEQTVNKMRAQSMRAEAETLVNKASEDNLLNAKEAEFELKVLTGGGVEGFEDRKKLFTERMAMRSPVVKTGRLMQSGPGNPPDNRETVINKSKEAYVSDSRNSVTSMVNWVNDDLREAQMERLSDDEAKKLGAA